MFVETCGRGEWHGRETGHNKAWNLPPLVPYRRTFAIRG
jgi:hypothetical protein